MPKFTPRQRKHKIRKRLEQDSSNVGVPSGNDSNSVEILPSTITEKEKKWQEIENTIRTQQPKVSSKKQRRLDKYIVSRLPLKKAIFNKHTRTKS